MHLSPESLARCQARAHQLVPGAACETATHLPRECDAELLCLVHQGDGATPRGRTCIARFPHFTAEPLHARLTRFSKPLGRAFGPSGMFHHVGERPCMREEPGVIEEYWVNAHARSPKVTVPPRWAIQCATVGGIGFLPIIGANTASLVTVVGIASLSLGLPTAPVAAVVTVLSTALSVAVESAAARWFLAADAREFVLDEVAGMATALIFIPPHGSGWLFVLAFVGFRFFDILKPGIQWVERLPLPGKIVWDDLLAGLYAGLVVAAAAWFL